MFMITSQVAIDSLGKKIVTKNFIIKTHINNNHIEQDASEYILELNKILIHLKKKKLLQE